MSTITLAERPTAPLTITETPESIHTTKWSIRLAAMYEATEKLPEDQKGALRALDHHARSKNLSLREVAAELKDVRGNGYSDNTLYKVMTGKHEAKLDNIVRSVLNYLRPFAERAPESKIPYIPISHTESIIEYCELAKKYGRMGLIVGRNQGGKTTSFTRLAITKPFGQVQVYRAPTNGYLSQLVAYMCIEKGISTKHSTSDQKEKLIRTYDPSQMVIFDDMHQCYMGAPKRRPRLDTFDFGREIFDRTGATVIHSFTPIVSEAMDGKGPDALFFEQIKHRALPPYYINPIVPAKDLNKIADVLGLEPADDEALTLQTNIIAKEGLGYWLMYLQCARGVAAKGKRTLSWDDVLEADRTFQAISRKKGAVK